MGTGLYVACWLGVDDAEALAVGGEPAGELHLTLCYLGDLGELPAGAAAAAQAAIAPVAATHQPMNGSVSGVGVLKGDDQDVLVALPDLPGLACLRDCVHEALCAAGLEPVETHGFLPHITLAYLEPGQTVPLPPFAPVPLRLQSVSVVSPGADPVTVPLGAAQVLKDEPSDSDVHVDAPVGDQAKPKRRKIRRRKPAVVVPGGSALTVVKADDEKQVVYGIVLQPDVADSQGDVVTRDDIEAAAWRFLYDRVPLALQHAALAPDTVRPVESFLAPVDFQVETPRGTETVRKGSWIVAAHVPDPQVWAGVKEGGFTGWSVAGTGKRTRLVEKAAPAAFGGGGEDWMAQLAQGLVGLFSDRFQKQEPPAPPVVNVNVPQQPAPVVNVTIPEQPPQPAPVVNVNVPRQEPPVVHVAPAAVSVEPHIHVAAAETHPEPAQVTVAAAPRVKRVRVRTDAHGKREYVPEYAVDGDSPDTSAS